MVYLFIWTLYYLVNDVAILSMDLCDRSQIPQDPERLIELKQMPRVENKTSVFNKQQQQMNTQHQ